MRRPFFVLVACIDLVATACGPARVNDRWDDRRSRVIPAEFETKLEGAAELAHRDRPAVLADGVGEDALIGVTPAHSVVASRDGGRSWTRLVAAPTAHLPVVDVVRGSSTDGTTCLQARVLPDIAHAMSFCREASEGVWLFGDRGLDDTPREPVPIRALGSDGLGRSWRYGLIRRQTTSQDRRGQVPGMPFPSALPTVSGDGGRTWTIRHLGTGAKHVAIYPSTGGIALSYTLPDSPQPAAEYCRAGWQCEPIEPRRTSFLEAYEGGVTGRSLYWNQATGTCWLYADNTAAGAAIGSSCENVVLLRDAAQDVVALQATATEVRSWRRDEAQPAYVFALPEPGCVLGAEHAGYFTCVGTASLYASTNLGASWETVCQAGSCALYDATAEAVVLPEADAGPDGGHLQ